MEMALEQSTGMSRPFFKFSLFETLFDSNVCEQEAHRKWVQLALRRSAYTSHKQIHQESVPKPGDSRKPPELGDEGIKLR